MLVARLAAQGAGMVVENLNRARATKMFTLKKLFLATILLLSRFAGAASIPDAVTGIWATADTAFRGDALLKGDAIYLDSDGVGAWIGGNGKDVLGVRLVVTSFDPATHILAFKMTEYGKDGPAAALVYDPARHVLTSGRDGKQFALRQAGPLSAQQRRALGLRQEPVR